MRWATTWALRTGVPPVLAESTTVEFGAAIVPSTKNDCCSPIAVSVATSVQIARS
jgi:hypothetical protein